MKRISLHVHSFAMRFHLRYRAETGYGYLHVGDAPDGVPDGVRRVRAFVEKPDAARAEASSSCASRRPAMARRKPWSRSQRRPSQALSQAPSPRSASWMGWVW